MNGWCLNELISKSTAEFKKGVLAPSSGGLLQVQVEINPKIEERLEFLKLYSKTFNMNLHTKVGRKKKKIIFSLPFSDYFLLNFVVMCLYKMDKYV